MHDERFNSASTRDGVFQHRLEAREVMQGAKGNSREAQELPSLLDKAVRKVVAYYSCKHFVVYLDRSGSTASERRQIWTKGHFDSAGMALNEPDCFDELVVVYAGWKLS